MKQSEGRNALLVKQRRHKSKKEAANGIFEFGEGEG